MIERTDLGTFLAAMRPAARLPLRLIAAAAVLITAILLKITMDLPEPPSLRICILSTLVLWFLWSVAGGMILRAPHLAFAGRPVRAGACVAHGLGRFVSHFGAPLLVVLVCAGLLAVVYSITQVVRIPVVGWPLLALLLPVLLVLSFTAARLLLRWLSAGFLAGPSIAEGTADAWRALFRAQAFWKADARRVLLVRLLAFGAWIFMTIRHLVLYALALGALWLVLGLVPGDRDRELLDSLGDGLACDGGTGAIASLVFVALLFAWVVSRPAAAFFGARAGAYLVLRRDLDDVPIDAPVREPDPEKSMEELGIELVRRLRDELGED